jgi:hypothetical protein
MAESGAQEAIDQKVLGPLADCVRDRGRLIVALVMDQSGSLRDTDPDDQRIVAAETAMAGLARLGSTANADGKTPRIDLLLSGFDSSFQPLQRDGATEEAVWRSLDNDQLAGVVDSLQAFGARDTGRDTDFYAALAGARTAIASRSAALTADGTEPPCKALLLFTDGAYSIEAQDGEKPYAPGLAITESNIPKVIELGKRAVCKPGGVSDHLRDDGVVPLVASLNATAFDQSFITSFATGNGCGNNAGDVAGLYVSAKDLSGLLRLFDGIGSVISGGSPFGGGEETPVCPRHACVRGTRKFFVDDSLSSFHVLVQLGATGIETEIRGPGDSKPLVIVPGQPASTKLGGVPVSVAPLSPQAFSLDASRPVGGGDWEGTWSVTFIDRTNSDPGAVVRSQIYLYGDLVPVFVGHPEFRSGTPSELEVRVATKEGEPTNPSLVRSTQLDLTVTDPESGAEEALNPTRSGDSFKATYTANENKKISSVNVTAVLSVETSTGVTLVPTSSTISVPILPPAEFPSIKPSQLRLPALLVNDTDESLGELTVLGPDSGTGCVWFDGADFEKLPPGTSDPEVTFDPAAGAQGKCISVRAGEKKTVAVRVVPGDDTGGSGSAAGNIVAHLRSDASGEVLDRDIPLAFDVAVKANALLLWFLFLVLGLCLLIPLAVLWVVNRANGKFQPLRELRGASIAVRVSGTSVSRMDPTGRESALAMATDDFENVGGDGKATRKFSWRGISFSAFVPANPFANPWGEASGSHCAGSWGMRERDGEVKGKVPLALPGAWVFKLETIEREDAESGPSAVGSLHAFIADGIDTASQTERIIDQVNASLPESVRPLIERSRNSQGPTGAGSVEEPVQEQAEGPEPSEGPEPRYTPKPPKLPDF